MMTNIEAETDANIETAHKPPAELFVAVSSEVNVTPAPDPQLPALPATGKIYSAGD
jgi:hypothetical protein